MKRVLTQKVKPIPTCAIEDRGAEESLKAAPTEANRRVGRSAAMIGLAISMGASSLLLPQQGDGARATEPTDGSAVSTVPAEAQEQSVTAAAEMMMPKQPAVPYQDREGQTIGSNTQTNQVQPTVAAATNLPSLSATVTGDLTIPGLMEKSQGISPADNSLQGIAPAIVQRANGYSSNYAADGDSFAARRLATPEVSLPSVIQPSSLAVSEGVAGTVPHPVDRLLKAKQSVAIDRLRDSSNRLRNSLAEWKSEESTNLAAQTGDTEPYQAYVPSYVNPVASSQQESAVVSGQTEAVGDTSVTDTATATVTAGIQPQSGAPTTLTPALPQVVVPEPAVTAAVMAVYQVQSGDTLSGIAQNYGVRPTVLAQTNHLNNPNRLQVAQLLAIPSSEKGSAASQNFPADLRESPKMRPGEHLPASTSLLTNVAVSTKQRSSSTLTVAVVPGLAINPERDRNNGPTVPLSDDAASVPMAASGDPNLGTDIPDPSFKSLAGTKQLTVGDPETGKSSQEEDRGAIATQAKQENNPYIERLRAELSQLREQYRHGNVSESTPATAPQAPSTAAAAPVNPEFDSRRYNRAVQTEIERRADQTAAPTPRTQTPSVATAPLGADPYQPYQPTRGQMVSPDLPPLGDPNQYLPGGSNQNFNGFMWPTKGVLTSGYGRRWGRMHKGIDIAAPTGTPIFAAAPGVVVYARWNSGGYGNLVDIRHADGTLTRYGHNSRIFVQEGQVVEQGQHISAMGSTGFSTGPHLHFEVHPGGRGAVNPIAFLPRRR